MNAVRLRIYLSHRGFGFSMGNMIQLLSGEASVLQEGNWIDVVEEEPGVFVVVDDNMTVKNGDYLSDATNLGFVGWDDEVVDLDDGNSDEAQCFGMSSQLRFKEVVLAPDVFHAPNFESLVEALQHISVCAWCPGDI